MLGDAEPYKTCGEDGHCADMRSNMIMRACEKVDEGGVKTSLNEIFDEDYQGKWCM